jgi:hypothetical protein
MPEQTLETVIKRVEALEQQLAELRAQQVPKTDWLRVVGISEDNEFTRQVLTEIERNSEAERRAALEAQPE